MLPNNSGPIVMHFGLPKTGTTSIQVSLFRHLADPRFHYVKLGKANANYRIASGFRPDPTLQVHVRRGTSVDELQHVGKEAVEGLEAQLVSAGDKTAILSSEAISGLRESELREFCHVLAKHRQPVTAVGYVRRPKEYMESVFQQRVKAGSKALQPSRLFPRFHARFEKFDAVLGRENVWIWLFDPALFPGHCVVQDFCSRLGIRFSPENVVRANEGLSYPALSLLFAYWKFGPGVGVGLPSLSANKLLVQRVKMVPGPKLRLHSSLVSPVIEAQRRNIAWMEERLGASLTEDLTADDEHAIRSEEDLLRFSPDALRWLAEELGEAYARRWHPRMNPQEVADWMHLLRIKLSGTDEGFQSAAVNSTRSSRTSINQIDPGGKDMRIDELVRSAKQSAPDLATLAEKDAQHLVREVFGHIRRQIEATRDGKIEIGGLGLFRIKQGEREKDGRKIPVKRVVFRSEKASTSAE